MFALGAAKKSLVLLRTLRKISDFGDLSATVSNPPVVILGTISFALRITDSGPGQSDSVSLKKLEFVKATLSASLGSRI